MGVNPFFVGKLLFLLFAGITVIGAARIAAPVFFQLSPDRPGCDTPVSYGVGDVDDRFPLDREAFLSATFEAEAVWEQGLGKDVFAYDPQSPFRIVTLFDDRQKMTVEARDLKDTVASYEKKSGTLGKEYDALLAKHDRDTKRFETQAAAFNKAVARYNEDVAEWNERGGAPPDEYEALEKTRKKLDKDEQALIEASASQKTLTERINALGRDLNTQAGIVNENIAEFKERYGEPRPFIQGLYTPPLSSIEIFQFEGRDDLRLVLAHEFGHALGIEEHVGDDHSLMYFLMGGQDLSRPSITGEDIVAYRAACPERHFSKRETIARYLVLTPFSDMDLPTLAGLVLRAYPNRSPQK